MKKIYFLLLFYFIFSKNIFASNQRRPERNYKEMYEFYQSFKQDMNDDRMLAAVQTRKKDQSDQSALHFCIASYICSDSEIKEALEEELGKNDLAIKVGKDILSNINK